MAGLKKSRAVIIRVEVTGKGKQFFSFTDHRQSCNAHTLFTKRQAFWSPSIAAKVKTSQTLVDETISRTYVVKCCHWSPITLGFTLLKYWVWES